jgi:invasion protein IalB
VAPVQRPKAPPTEEAKPGANQGQTQNQQGQQSPAPMSAQNSGWIARCVSDSRQSPVECSMEQTVLLSTTGQLLASLAIRVPTETRAPILLLRVPNGLNLPAGLALQIDDGTPQSAPVQTCDQQGCYMVMQVTAELLASLKSGKRLTVTYQMNTPKNNVTVPLALDSFAEAYQKIQ